MASPPKATEEERDATLDPLLAEQLPTFELFFKTFGFKRIHGRVWGLRVLSEGPLSSKEISSALGISTGTAKSRLNRAMAKLRLALEADAPASGRDGERV